LSAGERDEHGKYDAGERFRACVDAKLRHMAKTMQDFE
jgi:hypothetical protein